LFILFDFYFDSKIGTPEFTELATDTICGSSRKYFIVITEFQDILGAKMDTYAAPFAPFTVYNMLF
jgi:hypothetical protein